MTTLKYMREEFKKLQWALYLVIAAFIILIFAAWGSGGKLGSQRTTDVVLSIGHTSVTSKVFYKYYQNQLDLYRQIYKEKLTPDLIRNMNIPMQVVNQIVQQEMISALAKEAGVAVTDDDVFKKIMSYKVFKDKEGKFVGDDLYRRVLKANQTTPFEFEASIRKELVADKYRKILENAVVISESEAKEEFMKQNLSADVDSLMVYDTMFMPRVTLSEEEIKTYYDQHKEEFNQPEKRKVNYLLADLSKIKPTIPMDDSVIKAYYNSHQERFTQEEQVHARHILIKTDKRSDKEAKALAEKVKKQIEKGLDFAAAARKYSEDPSNAKTGGDLGFFGKGRMVPAFEKAAFSLKEGVVSQPVKTQYGYHIIQVLGLKPAGVKPLNEVEFVIRNALTKDQAGQMAQERARDLYAALVKIDKVDAKVLRNMADTDPLVVLNTTDFFAEGDTVPGIGKNESFMSAVFSKDMKAGSVTPPITTGRGVLVAMLTEIQPEGVPPLEKIKSKVTTIVKEKKAHEMTQKRLLEVLANGENLDQIAKSFNLKVKRGQKVKYLSPIPGLGRSHKVHDVLFSVKTGEVTNPIEVKGGWTLCVVNSRDAFDKKAFADKHDDIVERIKGQQVSNVMRAAVEEMKKKIKVTYNQAYLAKLTS